MIFKQKIQWRPIVLSIISIFMTSCGNESSPDIEASQNVETRQESEINSWGEVEYQYAYQIIVDFTATVEEIKVKEGDVVHKGDVLAVLDVGEFHKTIARLEDQKSAGEAALAGIYQNTDGLKAQIEQQKRDVATAQNDWNNAKILYDAGDISNIEYEKSVTNLETQKMNQRVLEVELSQMETSNSSNYSQQASSNAALEKEIDIYKDRLRKAYLNDNQIVCNVENGIIKDIYVDNGTMLGGDVGLVMEIIDQDSVYVNAEVDEEFIRDITPLTPVRIVPIMDPSLELTGTVSQISALAVEKDGGRIIKVRVDTDDLDRVLKPGYTVDVYFATYENQDLHMQ